MATSERSGSMEADTAKWNGDLRAHLPIRWRRDCKIIGLIAVQICNCRENKKKNITREMLSSVEPLLDNVSQSEKKNISVTSLRHYHHSTECFKNKEMLFIEICLTRYMETRWVYHCDNRTPSNLQDTLAKPSTVRMQNNRGMVNKHILLILGLIKLTGPLVKKKKNTE